MFQLTKDRCEQLDGYTVGDELHVEFNLRGREWHSPSGEVKYFNTLEAWRVEPAGERRQTRTSRGPGGKQSAPQTTAEDEGEIPF
jgi:hypothetical protein